MNAVKRVHSLLNTGHHEVVDADLSNYFGEIPHAELMNSIARRVSDGRMLGLIKSWLVDAGAGGRWQGRQTPNEPSEKVFVGNGHSSRVSDFSVAEQHLHASLHTGMEAVGLCPAISRGDCQLRG